MSDYVIDVDQLDSHTNDLLNGPNMMGSWYTTALKESWVPLPDYRRVREDYCLN